jgi:predicted nucleic acid-binding protein
MKLVIDTNRLMAALLKTSASREIILSEKIEFYSPEYMITEIEKHRKYLMKKSKLNNEDFNFLLSTLLKKIKLVPFEEFKHKYMDAVKIMINIDINDSAFLALGLAMKADGIWTRDKGYYEQNELKVYSTKELLNFIKK